MQCTTRTPVMSSTLKVRVRNPSPNHRSVTRIASLPNTSRSMESGRRSIPNKMQALTSSENGRMNSSNRPGHVDTRSCGGPGFAKKKSRITFAVFAPPL